MSSCMDTGEKYNTLKILLEVRLKISVEMSNTIISTGVGLYKIHSFGIYSGGFSH